MTASRAVNAMCVTPFDAHDRLDEAALMVIVDWLAAAGVGIYLGSYGTGEGHLLRPAEIVRLYEIGVEAAAGRVPVYGAALGFNEHGSSDRRCPGGGGLRGRCGSDPSASSGTYRHHPPTGGARAVLR